MRFTLLVSLTGLLTRVAGFGCYICCFPMGFYRLLIRLLLVLLLFQPSALWLQNVELSVLPLVQGSMVVTDGSSVAEVSLPIMATSDELKAALLTLPAVKGIEVMSLPSFFGWPTWSVTFQRIEGQGKVKLLTGVGSASVALLCSG